jgi:hypothetical protein
LHEEGVYYARESAVTGGSGELRRPCPSGGTHLNGYRRWTIERLHYTLKSGLGAEKLQIDDATSLSHALALHYVVACRLLQLTYLARHDPEHPALDVLSPDEVAVLSMAEGKPIRTVAAAVLAIAKQGGYAPYRTAPPPGVKVLWLGLQRLHGMALGWRLARTANAGGTAG